MHNSLPTLEEIVSLTEADEKRTFQSEVAKRRTRLNAGSLRDVENEVAKEVYGSSKLPHLYDEILNHSDTSDELRRLTESKQLRHVRDHLFSLPLDDPRKQKLATEVEKLTVKTPKPSRDMALIPSITIQSYFLMKRSLDSSKPILSIWVFLSRTTTMRRHRSVRALWMTFSVLSWKLRRH